jgi:hypothetical protein
MFQRGPCLADVRKTIGPTKFSSVRESVKKELEGVKLKNLHC